MRVCYACGSIKTHLGKNYHRSGLMKYSHWYLNRGTDLVLCHYCNKKIIVGWGPLEKRQHFIRYKGAKIRLASNPRKGKCFNCGKADGKKTHMHHLYYDDNDPLAGTVELCMRCHHICTLFESREARLLFVNNIIKI